MPLYKNTRLLQDSVTTATDEAESNATRCLTTHCLVMYVSARRIAAILLNLFIICFNRAATSSWFNQLLPKGFSMDSGELAIWIDCPAAEVSLRARKD